MTANYMQAHKSIDPLGRAFWLLGLTQAAHSIEEMVSHLYDFMWVATERLGLPSMGMTATTFAAVNMGIIALFLFVTPFVFARHLWAIGVAWIAAVVEILNGLGHLSGAVIFRGYVPGAATAPFLILCGVVLLMALRRQRSLT
jgi:hypothetical protein